MFGYVGSSDCRFSENCIINDIQYKNGGILHKYERLKNMEKKNLKIYKDTPKFKEFEQNAIIKFDDAREIYRKNLHDGSVPFLFCENGCYIFDKTLSGLPRLYSINAQTGKLKELKNYPYEKE